MASGGEREDSVAHEVEDGVAEMIHVRVFHLSDEIAGLRVRLSSASSCCVLQIGGEKFLKEELSVRTTAKEWTGEDYLMKW